MLEGRVLLSAGTPTTVDVTWDGQQVAAVQGQYISYTKEPNAFLSLAGKEGFTGITSLGGNGFYQFSSDLAAAQIQKLAKAHPNAMGTTEPNAVETAAATIPNDAYFSQQYNLDNTGQPAPFDYNGDGVIEPFEDVNGTPGQDINATAAWDITTGSSDVIVADLDTGMDINQPDLAANVWQNPNPNGQPNFPDDVNGWNFVSNDNDVLDDFGHGTETAGVISAVGNNGIGISGVSWHTTLLPVKVLNENGEGTDADIIAGINYVVMLKSQGVNIVVMNISIGGAKFPFDILESQALAAAGKAGILAAVAAGNDGENNDQGLYLGSAPASLSVNNSNVITVAAVDALGNLAYFSNYGAASVQIAAPGVNILSTEPSYELTDSTGAQTFFWTPLAPASDNPYGIDSSVFTVPYGFQSGTSYAAPTVAGIIALEAAANPQASPAELKAALLQGARFDPALASVNGTQPKVATSGVADAYTAVKDVLNYHVATNTTRSGNWVNYFGSAGASIIGDTTDFPSFATIDFSGGTPVVLNTTTRQTAALQRESNPAERVSAYEAAATSETINIDFTDGNSHQVSLYVADLDKKHRSELVQVIDPATGLVYDSEEVTKFTKGEYLVWNLQGDVDITITNQGGPNAVFSGIFFDGVSTSPSLFLGTNTTISGANWRNQYGSQGDVIAGDNNADTNATYVSSLTMTGETTKILSAANANPTALAKNYDIARNITAYWSSSTSFDIDLIFSDANLHQVTLYAADYENKNRSERIEEIDPTTGDVLASTDILSFHKGVFVTFNASGSVDFRVINTGSSKSNAVISGIFFDATPGQEVTFEGVDTTTQGNWPEAGYGTVNSLITGYNFPGFDVTPPLLPIVTSTAGATEKIVTAASSDPRALLTTASGLGRVEAYLYTTTSMTISLNFQDSYTHEVALYFADYEKDKRSEFVGIYDAVTGATLSYQRVTNFQNGKYFVYDISDPVTIVISSASYPNAVLSGIFTN